MRQVLLAVLTFVNGFLFSGLLFHHFLPWPSYFCGLLTISEIHTLCVCYQVYLGCVSVGDSPGYVISFFIRDFCPY